MSEKTCGNCKHCGWDSLVSDTVDLEWRICTLRYNPDSNDGDVNEEQEACNDWEAIE